MVHIAHNCTIGKHCLITAGFLIAGSSKIGDFFVCGGGVSVTGHIEITDNVQLAGVTGVSKSIKEPGQYGGYPLTPIKGFLKWRATLPRVPELLKRVSRLEKLLKKYEDDK